MKIDFQLAQKKMVPVIELLEKAHSHMQNGLNEFAQMEQYLCDLAKTQLTEAEQKDLECIQKSFNEMLGLSKKHMIMYLILNSQICQYGKEKQKSTLELCLENKNIYEGSMYEDKIKAALKTLDDTVNKYKQQNYDVKDVFITLEHKGYKRRNVICTISFVYGTTSFYHGNEVTVYEISDSDNALMKTIKKITELLECN